MALVNLIDSAASPHMHKAGWGGSEITLNTAGPVDGYIQVPRWANRLRIRDVRAETKTNPDNPVGFSRMTVPSLTSSPAVGLTLPLVDYLEVSVRGVERVYLATLAATMFVSMEWLP